MVTICGHSVCPAIPCRDCGHSCPRSLVGIAATTLWWVLAMPAAVRKGCALIPAGSPSHQGGLHENAYIRLRSRAVRRRCGSSTASRFHAEHQAAREAMHKACDADSKSLCGEKQGREMLPACAAMPTSWAPVARMRCPRCRRRRAAAGEVAARWSLDPGAGSTVAWVHI